MGRAKGGPSAIDGFSQVLGARRGPMEVDTLLSINPSPSARRELQRLVAAPGFNETDEEMALLHRHRALLGERPLLDELATEVCLHQIEHAHGLWSRHTRELMLLAGLRGEFADQLFSDGEGFVHVCARGRDFRVDDELRTACGVLLTRSDISEVRRGGWVRSLSADLFHCSSCAVSAEEVPDAQEAANVYPALSPEMTSNLSTRLLAPVRADLDRTLASKRHPEVADILSSALHEYPQALLDFTAARMHSGGPAVIAHAVGRHHWRTLRTAVGVEQLNPADIWSLEEWRNHLLPFAPRERRLFTHSDTEYDQRDAKRESARDGLYAALAADLGVNHKSNNKAVQSATLQAKKNKSRRR